MKVWRTHLRKLKGNAIYFTNRTVCKTLYERLQTWYYTVLCVLGDQSITIRYLFLTSVTEELLERMKVFRDNIEKNAVSFIPAIVFADFTLSTIASLRTPSTFQYARRCNKLISFVRLCAFESNTVVCVRMNSLRQLLYLCVHLRP